MILYNLPSVDIISASVYKTKSPCLNIIETRAICHLKIGICNIKRIVGFFRFIVLSYSIECFILSKIDISFPS